MAKLYFKVGSDVDRVIQLRQEISKLKQELMSMDVNKAPAAAKALQTQIGAATQEFTKLTTEAAKAGAVMESDFKTKIYQSSQSVNDLTQKIIAQKAVVKDTEADVKRLGEAYRTALKNSRMSASVKLADYTSAKKALDEDKASLFGLTQEQANARLSVKKLRDEYALYRDESRGTVQINDGIGISLKKAFAIIGGAAAGKKLISDMIRVRGEFQAADTAIQTLLGSKEKADALMVKVKEYAKISPLEFSDVTASTKMMLGFNIEAEKVPRYLQAIGDISMGEASKFNSLTLAFSQMSATGKLMGQDLNQMINAGFNPLQQIATSTGKSIAVLKEEMSKGAISAEMVQQAFIDATSAGGKFFGMSENASKTINGQLSMMQDAIDSSLNEMGKKSEGIIMGSIHLTTKLVENYETVGRVIAGLVATYGAYRTALILNTVLEQGFNKAIWAKITATKAATIAQATYNKVVMMNPWVAAGAAIVSLGIAMWTLADHTTSAERAQERFNKKVDDAAKAAETHKRKLEELISELQNEVTAETRKMEILDEIKKGYPSLFQKIIDEKGHIKDLTEAWKAYNEEASKNKAIQNKDYVLELKKNVSDMKRIQDVFDKYGYDFKSYTKEDIALYEKYKPYDSSLKNKIEANERELWKWEKEVREDEFTQWKVDLKGKTNEQIKAIRDAMVERSKSAKGDNALLSALGKRITAVDNEIESRKAGNTTYEDEYNKAKKEWDTAKIALSDIEKDRSKFNVEQYEKAKELKETTEKRFKDLGGVTGTSLTKEESDSEKLRKQNAKFEELTTKQSSDRIRAEKDIQVLVDQARIDAMKEGGDKSIAQMRLNHQKEIEELKRMREDYLQKKIDAEKMRFDSNPGNKGKSFDASGISLDTNESKMFSDMMSHKVNKQGNDLSAYYKELLSKYKGYTEQRLSAQEKYQKERELLTKSGASSETLAEYDYQRDEALKAIDSEFAMREESFKSWADGITNLSLNKLQEMLVQAEQELQRSEFLNPKDTGLASQRAKVASLKSTISEKSEKAKTSPDRRSNKEWQDLYKTLSKVERQFDDIGDTVEGTAGEIISAAGGISTATLQMVDGIVTLANGSSQAMAGTAQAASASIQAVEKASVILAIIGAALQIATKIADMFAADYSDYNEAKKNYENYVKVLDIVIEKQKELIATLTGKEAVKASKDALELIEKQAQAARNLGKERLNAGASAGSSSIGVRIKKNMSNEGWNEVKSAIGINAYNKIKEGRMEGLFNLSVEQLKKLQMEAPEFWAKLDGDVSNYLEQIIACNEKTEEMKDILNESLTNTSFDSVRDGFLDALSDMNTSAADFADDFSSYMQKAILNTMMAKTYEKRLNDWYESFANSNKDGEIDKIDYDKLQKDWESIVSDALVDRDKLKELFGWTSDGSSQESTKGGFQAMSQDTGDELNGRFTALQISNEEIKNQGVLQAQSLEILSVKTDAILFVSTETRDIADETRTILANSYIELLQISENTGESAKHLKDIKSDIAEVKRNTGRI